MKVESLGFDIFRGPRGILPPHIRSGLENVGFRKLGVTAAFQILLEEREQYVFAVILAGVRTKLHASQMFAVITGPTAVNPRSNHERVEDSRVILFDRVECGERALQVFGIEPSADG